MKLARVSLLLLACNAPPEGGTLVIEPANPTTADALRAVVATDAADPNAKDTVTYTFAWAKDGEIIADLTGESVPADRTGKGQTWSVSATPTDGKKQGATFSAEVTIDNAAPSVTQVQITPSSATKATSLTVDFQSADPDEDVVEVAISWKANQREIGTSKTLSNTTFAKGDSITVTVTPNDGDVDGEPVVAGPIIVANSPPSKPTAAIDPSSGSPSSDLRCVPSAESTDADADPLLYSARWTLNGAAYSGALLTTNWPDDTVPKASLARGQVWTCTLTVDDGDATVDSVASAPLTITLPDTATFRAGYYWVVATYPAPLTDHAKVCEGAGLAATDVNVTLTWDATLLEQVSTDLGFGSGGDTNCCASAMWCWDGGESPFQPGAKDGQCETHNFGTSYNNYGTYTSSPFERPVFTCQ